MRVHPCLEAAVAIPDAPLADQARMVELCEESRLRWVAVGLLPAPTGLRVDTVGLDSDGRRRGSNVEGLNYLVKRTFDILCASLMLDCRDADHWARRSRNFNFRRPACFASSESARWAVDLKC